MESREPRELESQKDKIWGTPDSTMTKTMTPVRAKGAKPQGTSIAKRDPATNLQKVEHPVKRAKVEPHQGLKHSDGQDG